MLETDSRHDLGFGWAHWRMMKGSNWVRMARWGCVATAADASGDLQSDNGLLGMVGLSQFLYAICPNRRGLHGGRPIAPTPAFIRLSELSSQRLTSL